MNMRRAQILNRPDKTNLSIPVGGARVNQTRTPTSAVRIHSCHSPSRRLFLKTALASLGGAAIWLMNKAAKRAEIIPENAENILTVPWNPGHGVHFFDRLIVINNSAGIAVFSSLCPHLGCRIDKIEGAELVCPCHGSRFNLSGELVHGPAMRALRPLPFALDRSNSVLRVTLEN